MVIKASTVKKDNSLDRYILNITRLPDACHPGVRDMQIVYNAPREVVR